MTARTKLSSPLEIFHDIDGQPLEDGYIYIGTAGLDPATNPITVYWDEALTTAATQPIRTTAGFPVNAGVASRLYTGATDWSLRVSNKNNTQIHQDLNSGANGDGGGLIYVDNANSRVGIGNTSPAVPLDVTGDIRSSTGILFGSDTAAANLLDDYEEGTWTPVLTGATDGALTYTGLGQYGVYTKIGNTVHCTFEMQWSAIATSFAGNIQVTGIPFANGSGRWVGSMGAAVGGINCNGSYNRLTIWIDPSDSFAQIGQVDNTLTSGNNYSHVPTIQSTGILYGLTLTYTV